VARLRQIQQLVTPVTASPFSLRTLRLRDFRCIEHADLVLHASATVITGGNGAGKTSLLEAIHVLGRGRSFRSPDGRSLVRDGAQAADVVAEIEAGNLGYRLGAHCSSEGLTVSLDGHNDPRLADLARLMPVLALDASATDLIQGAPEIRRRLLDWGLFHVEHGYLEAWRRFRRALNQRNAGLRLGAGSAELTAWDREYLDAAAAVDGARQRYIRRLQPVFQAAVAGLLEFPAEVGYAPGWRADESLADVISAAREGDRAQGMTRFGPHRADLTIQVDSRKAKARSSRGHQKLLGAALVFSQARLVAEARGDRVVLLVDEPEADLDRVHTERLVTSLRDTPAQLVIASIACGEALQALGGAMFHVEHGEVKALL
jgi:DNA replication and repair protein RecF